MDTKFKNILIDEPFKIRVEKLSELKNGSLFKDVYAEAAKNTLKIIENSRKVSENDQEEFYNDIKDYNNIIAFTGDRGTGKTSAMISFAKAIEDLDSFKNEDDAVLFPEFQKIKETGSNFTCLKVIEPSNFIKEERLFEIVISNIFSQLTELVNERNRNVDKNDLRKIYEIFDEVYSALKTMYSNKKDMLDKEYDMGSGLEMLERLSIGEKLKKSFENLVTEYLIMNNKYTGRKYDNESIKNTFLIIPIDDLDMNMDNGFEMAEEIRKYLITKNIIVVMAINTGQFTKIIEQQYVKSFKELVDKGLMLDDPLDMAVKYLIKLIPTNRRIALPIFDVHSISSIKESNDEGKDIFLTDYFLSKIYSSTGIMLLKNDNQSHEIIPTNLRELNYLNKLLMEMEISAEEKDNKNILYRSRNNEDVKKKLSRNLRKFEDYFINSFINTKMPQLYTNILLELMKQDSENMNKYLVRALVGRNDDTSKDKKVMYANIENEKYPIIFEIASPYSLPKNISIGDMLFILQQILIEKSDYETRRFVAGIKIIYSMRMIRHIFIDNEKSKARKIIGEFLYNPEDSKLIRGDRERVKVYNLKYDSYFKENTNDFILNCMVLRYSSLRTTSNNVISRDAYKKNIYANFEYPFVGGATNNIVIDLTSFIANLIDIDTIKKRVNNKISIPDKYSSWEKEYVAVLPVWSLDFIDTFFANLKRMSDLVSKDKVEDNYYSYVENFLNGFIRVINDIINNNSYLSNSNLIVAFNTNPIISVANFKERGDLIIKLGEWYEKDKDKEKEDINYTSTKPNEIVILGETEFFKTWAQVLITLIGKLCDQNPNNYNLIKKSEQLKQLNISSIEKVDKETRKKIKSRTLPDQYIKTNFNANVIVKLCKAAIRVTGNNAEDDFTIVSFHGEE